MRKSDGPIPSELRSGTICSAEGSVPRSLNGRASQVTHDRGGQVEGYVVSCGFSLPAWSRAQPTSCSRSNRGASCSKYFRPVTSVSAAVTSGRLGQPRREPEDTGLDHKVAHTSPTRQRGCPGLRPGVSPEMWFLAEALGNSQVFTSSAPQPPSLARRASVARC